MTQDALSTPGDKLQQALHSMESALQLLDDADAPADIGAHLDLAICRLKEALDQSSEGIDQLGSIAPYRRN